MSLWIGCEKDGVTHQTIEVFNYAAIPNMTILNPADDIECEKMVDFCFQHNGPIYLRTGKSLVPRIYQDDYSFRLGSPRAYCGWKSRNGVGNG